MSVVATLIPPPHLRRATCLQELFCNRLHIFPNLVRLYLNRLQVEVRGSLRERVVGALRCQQPYAGVDTMEVELPEPFDDDDLEFWEV